jgi:thioesterase domain-containing protein
MPRSRRAVQPDVSTPASGTGTNVPFQHLVLLQRGAAGRPAIYCVHGAGGEVDKFGAIIGALGPEQPFFGLKARGLGGEPFIESIEEMATLYVEAMRREQPHGPYFLAGYSGGGIVALEMAQQLRAAGERVPLIAFIDTFHPTLAPRQQTLQDRLKGIRQEGVSYFGRILKRRLKRLVEERVTAWKQRFYAKADGPLPADLQALKLFDAFEASAARYVPRAYDGKVVLYRARWIAEIYQHMGPALGWHELSQLEIVQVPGGHNELIAEPNVRVLTQHLTRSIAALSRPG